jgi:hypothetical protein
MYLAVITVRLSKIYYSPYKFKKTVLSKSGRSGALSGLILLFFLLTSLWPSAGSRRPNRAAVTPIGQQNPPRPLKLFDLRKKTCKKPFFILPTTPVFLVYVCTSL